MCVKCNKIPELIEMENYKDYHEYEDAIYNAYEVSYGSKHFSYNGMPIYQKKMPLFKDKPCTFWHIISSGPEEASRIPDLRRYERVQWPGYILSYCVNQCNNILIWETTRKSKQRVLIWCKDIDYLVVLDKRKDFYLFWTAYPVTYGRKRHTLQAEYDAYIIAKAAH